MKPAQSTTVGPVERVRGIKNKDINPFCLSLSPGRSGSDLPGCLWGPSVFPQTCSAYSEGLAQAGLPLNSGACAALVIYKYPSSWEASFYVSVSIIFMLQVIEEHFSPNYFFMFLHSPSSWSYKVTCCLAWQCTLMRTHRVILFVFFFFFESHYLFYPGNCCLGKSKDSVFCC